METVLYNANIITMDAEYEKAQALLVRDGRFAAVGTNEEVLDAATQDAQRIDMKGAAVYPGLIDSHLHILHWAVNSLQLDLNGCRTRSEVLAAIEKHAQGSPEGSWIDCNGFNEDLLDDPRLLTLEEMDAAAPNHALRVTRVCCHMVQANSLAMKKAGITAETPVPEGGSMDLARGIFAENAMALILPDCGDRGLEMCKQLLQKGMKHASDAGLTGVWSDDFEAGGFSMPTVAEAYRQLEAEGRMPVRVVQQCHLPDDESWERFCNAGFHYGLGSDMYRIGPRKLYADGSLGARTAWLTVPYADQPDTTGVPIYSQQEMNRRAEQSHRAGMPFIVHSIGNGGTECVLNAIEYARKAVPGSECLPSGIVHCQITSADQLQRIAELNATVYAQPVFCEYDLHICRDRVGEELQRTSYNWATLLHSGVCISSGSDSPIEPLEPAKNIYCAVTRKDFDGKPEGGWLPEECLTVKEAVECHTLQAARAVGMEDRLGMIRKGYLADVTVYPMALDAVEKDDIKELKPLMTMVGGRVYRKEQA